MFLVAASAVHSNKTIGMIISFWLLKKGNTSNRHTFYPDPRRNTIILEKILVKKRQTFEWKIRENNFSGKSDLNIFILDAKVLRGNITLRISDAHNCDESSQILAPNAQHN